MKFVFATVFLFIGYIACAQINTEMLREELDRTGFGNEVSFYMDYNSGNSNSNEIKTSYKGDYKADEFYTFVAGYLKYKFVEKDMVSHKGYAHFRFIYDKHGFWRPEAFSQTNFDRAANLDSRYLAGAGMRLNLLDPDVRRDSVLKLELQAGVGAMWEREVLNYPGNPETELIRSTNYVNFNILFNRILSIYTATYFQPAFENPSDFRIKNDSELRLKISKLLSMSVVVDYRFDNEPPPEVEKYDLEIETGINITF